MQDALPPFYRICLDSVSAMPDDTWTSSWGPGCSPKFVEPHRAWLYEFLGEMARLGRYRCAVRLPQDLQFDTKSPPFSSADTHETLKVHNAKRSAFNRAMGEAMRALRGAIDWREHNSDLRRQWLSRWMATGGLTAYLRLGALSPRNQMVVPLDAGAGEDPALATAQKQALYADCRPEVLGLLPMHKMATFDAMQRCVDSISDSFDALGYATPGSMHYRSIAAEIVDLLCCCTKKRVLPPGEWSDILQTRLVEFLVRTDISPTIDDAELKLAAVGILPDINMMKPGSMMPSALSTFMTQQGNFRARLESPESVYQAAHRGMPHYVRHLATACAQRGILTARTVDYITTSIPLRNELNSKYFGDMRNAVADLMMPEARK